MKNLKKGTSIWKIWGGNLRSKEKRQRNWKLLSRVQDFMDEQFMGRNVENSFFWNEYDCMRFENKRWDFRTSPLILDDTAREEIVNRSQNRLSLNHNMKKVNSCRISLLRDEFHLEMFERGMNEFIIQYFILSDENWGFLYHRCTKEELDLYSPRAHFMYILNLQIELLCLYYDLEWFELTDPNRTSYIGQRPCLIRNIIYKRIQIATEEKLFRENSFKLPAKLGKIEHEKLSTIFDNIELLSNSLSSDLFRSDPSPLEREKQIDDASYQNFLKLFEATNGSFDLYTSRLLEINDSLHRFRNIKDSFIKGDDRSGSSYKDGIGSYIDCIVKHNFLFFMDPELQDTFPNFTLGDI